jgi:hypothetical protein
MLERASQSYMIIMSEIPQAMILKLRQLASTFPQNKQRQLIETVATSATFAALTS